MGLGIQTICWGVAAICFLVAVTAIRAQLNQDKKHRKSEDQWDTYKGEGTWLKPRD